MKAANPCRCIGFEGREPVAEEKGLENSDMAMSLLSLMSLKEKDNDNSDNSDKVNDKTILEEEHTQNTLIRVNDKNDTLFTNLSKKVISFGY